MKKSLFVSLIFILNLSCSDKKQNQKRVLSKEMVEESIISFQLDNESKSPFNSTDYNLKKDIFSFVNIYNNSLYIYKNTSQINKVNLSTTGPDGLGNLMFLKHRYINKDSILIYQVNQSKLYTIDNSGVIKSKHILANDQLYNPFYSQITPIQMTEKSILFPVTRENHYYNFSKNKSFLALNAESGFKNFFLNYPKVYDKKLWGSQFKCENSIAVKNDQVYVLYPITDTIQSINLKNGKEDKHLATSKFIDDFKPFRELESKEDFKKHDYIAEKNFSLSESDHTALLYHDKLKLFFVINYLRPTLNEVRNGIKIPDFSVAYFDDNFQKLGEHKFKSRKYFHTLIFKHKKGVMIGRRDLYRKNENKLSFSVFRFENVKK